jgi:hypothetical protein
MMREEKTLSEAESYSSVDNCNQALRVEKKKEGSGRKQDSAQLHCT